MELRFGYLFKYWRSNGFEVVMLGCAKWVIESVSVKIFFNVLESDIFYVSN